MAKLELEEEEEERVMPRRVFESIKRNCADTLRSPFSSLAAKAGARSRLGQLLDREMRGGVG